MKRVNCCFQHGLILLRYPGEILSGSPTNGFPKELSRSMNEGQGKRWMGRGLVEDQSGMGCHLRDPQQAKWKEPAGEFEQAMIGGRGKQLRLGEMLHDPRKVMS